MKLTDSQKKKVTELVGKATVQWTPKPEGVFNDVEVVKIVKSIIGVVEGTEPFTAEDIEEAISTVEDFDYYELEHDTVTIPGIGTTEPVDRFGGEGMGDERWVVFKLENRLFRISGYYSSWEGTEWYEDVTEVKPVEVVKTEYEAL